VLLVDNLFYFLHHVFKHAHCVFVHCKCDKILIGEVEELYGVGYWEHTDDFLDEVGGVGVLGEGKEAVPYRITDELKFLLVGK